MPSNQISKLLISCKKIQCKKFSYLPNAIFIIDDLSTYKQVIIHLRPKTSLVIVRDYHNPERKIFSYQIADLCKQRQIKLLIAGDPILALQVKADGLHISNQNYSELKIWKSKMPKWMITASAHNLKQLTNIKNYGFTAATFSPIFPTNTHPNAHHIGLLKFMKNVKIFNYPVYALGGITLHNINSLYYSQIAGIAGISIFTNLATTT